MGLRPLFGSMVLPAAASFPTEETIPPMVLGYLPMKLLVGEGILAETRAEWRGRWRGRSAVALQACGSRRTIGAVRDGHWETREPVQRGHFIDIRSDSYGGIP